MLGTDLAGAAVRGRNDAGLKGIRVDLQHCRNGVFVRTAGCVIARQRPGTAKWFIFLSMEDETGIANVIVTPTFTSATAWW